MKLYKLICRISTIQTSIFAPLKYFRLLLGIFALLTLLTACASTQVDNVGEDKNKKENKATTNDPYEGYNRVVFKFNTELDKFIIKPIAKFYYKVVPRPLYHGITNFFDNLDTIPTIFNDVLQAKFYQGISDVWRFGINSTIGIGGVFDIASHMDLPRHHEDFGLTLAYWGWQDSDYFVLPFLGPSTIRDTVAVPVNWLMSVYWIYFPRDDYTTYALFGLNLLNKRVALLEYEKAFGQIILDPYVFYRDAYLQQMAFAIKQNNKSDVPPNIAEITASTWTLGYHSSTYKHKKGT